MATSLRTIADACDVSMNTVSNILNRGMDHLYNPDTIQKIRTAASEQGYRPNLAAKMLMNNASNMIGLVAWRLARDGNIANPVIYPFLVGASDYLAGFGYHIVLVGIDEFQEQDKRSIPEALDKHFFDSLILQQGRWENIREWEEKSAVPIVSWDSGVFDEHNCVYRNELEVGRLLTTKLIALGHKKIAFSWYSGAWDTYQQLDNSKGVPQGEVIISHLDDIKRRRNISSNQLHYSVVHRYEGYLSVMREQGLEPSRLILGAVPDIAEQLLENRPTSVIILGTSNLFALEYACKRIGLQVPRDISVACCDVEARIPLCAEVAVGGVTYDRYQAGQLSAEMCLKLVKNKESREASVELVGDFRIGDTISNANG